jgi:oxygen-independent coproporphyrinogen-3 oxidase
MVNDGLITLNEQKITVLARGRLLIRNVCMVFDWHLRQSQQKKFSLSHFIAVMLCAMLIP